MNKVEPEQSKAQDCKQEGRSAYFRAFTERKWPGSGDLTGNLTDVVGEIQSTHTFPARGSLQIRLV